MLSKKQGVHSTFSMNAAGFCYTGHADTVRCDTCGLEVSEWTLDMRPFTIHSQRSPTCDFVRSIKSEGTSTASSILNFISTISTSNTDEKSSKRQKTEVQQDGPQSSILIEVNLLNQIRKRTFSHWPLRSSPSSAQMIQAGFFHCNVGDRVICLYCKIVCQQWTSNGDDPWHVHKTLSPKCPYVIAMLKGQQTASIHIVNEQNTRENTVGVTTDDPFRCHEVVYTAACNTDYIEIPRRYATFATWLNENTPSVDDLVRAGFFYSGTKTIVTCFYCNGSLQNWGKNDNPMIEHARWFPNCAYAKQLCGADLYRKIQESKKAQQARTEENGGNKQLGSSNNGSGNRGQLNVSDESTLSRFVAARLDLPISQSLLSRNYKLSVIKRCYEDQLRIKHNDFSDDCDILIACMILQNQITYIGGKKENIIIPHEAIHKIREREQAVIRAREQAAYSSSLTNSSNDTNIEMTTSTESMANTTEMTTPKTTDQYVENLKPSAVHTVPNGEVDNSSTLNACLLCKTEEKRLACIPCGHLTACTTCGRSLRLCPLCHREIEAFVRIYL
ncbi:unnamed protein product [Adineta steineri]|uniref:RING-type domain-containing protein n=1 Tax=Adineta steineri TaxID=433720 RepID=A0A818TYE0_9BILA|nr:unnamed protein product [Adineta steineri]CAF3690521.1 unnamed protein product [Adineta steineri]